MIKLVAISSLCVLFMAGCGGGGGSSGPQAADSVNSDGTCTDQFITDYNNIVIEKDAMDTDADILKYSHTSQDAQRAVTQLQTLSNACDQFFTRNLPTVSCTATANYKPFQASSANIKTECDRDKALLAEVTAPAPVVPAPIVDTNNGLCSQELIDDYNNVSVSLKDLKSTIAAGSADEDTIIRKGDAVNDSCDRFFVRHASDTICTAQNTDSGETMHVSTSQLKSSCDSMKAAVTKAKEAVQNGPR